MKRHGSMNHIFRLVWSHVLNAWVAVAENVRGRGKSSRTKLVASALSLTALSMLTSLNAQAGPQGGTVVNGDGSVSQNGSTTNIQQNSQKLSINWQSFNVGSSETVNFLQPSASAVAVNRIFDTNGSSILGHVNANGQVFLVNPNGVVFGKGAQVNVGGLVASTLDVSDAALNGNTRTFSGSGTGSVVNQGTITAANGGYVALVGNQVSNQGVISARLGTVALAAGKAVTLTFNDTSLTKIQVDQSTLNALAENRQLIQADGGQVYLTAGARDSLLASVVNNTGVIEARTVENHHGVITLLGGATAGTVNVDGSLNASAPDGGNGGFIETSAAHVKIADTAKLNTSAPSGVAGTWLIDPVDFTIAATGGDITGATLATNLGSGNVVIQSTNGGTGTAGNVNVNDSVTWSANKLTLNAQNNININANLNGSSTASLALEYGQGAVAAGNTSDYVIRGAAVNLAAGNNFSTKLGSDGTTTNYTVITSLGAAGSTTGTDLQGINGNLSGKFALGADINASPTTSWNSGAGLTPIGNSTTNFTGILAGLGHTINNPKINRAATTEVGVFGHTGSAAVIRDVGLSGGSVGGNGSDSVGGLVGNNTGTIINSYNSGNASGRNQVGGLVGVNSGTIKNAYTTGGYSGQNQVGGLVGSTTAGSISGSYSSASLSGQNQVGGLVGMNAATISDSYANGSISGQAQVGGLVGSNSGTINTSYANGSISSTSTVGGLVAVNTGTVNNSYWDTTATGQATSAGGTGLATTQFQQTSSYTGWDFTNTWILYDGFTDPLLRTFLRPLTVTAGNDSRTYDGTNYAGGNGGITYSATPDATLLGTLAYGGTAEGSRNAGTFAITPTGIYSNQQQGGYAINFVNGTLTTNKASLTLSTSNVTKVYDATTSASGSAVVTAGTLFGTDSTSGGTYTFTDKNVGAGTKTVTVSGVTVNDGNSGNNYNVSYVNNTTSTITAANLAVTGVTANNKVYNANTTATLGGTAAVAALGSDTVTVGGTGTGVFADKNVGNSKAVTVTGFTLGGADAGNYTIVQPTGVTANITPANLAITGVGAANKTYDATTAATLTGTAAVAALGSDTVTVTGTGSGTFADKNVGTGKTVTVTGYILTGADAGNYSVVQPSGVTANITAANLTLSTSNVSKVYDATTSAAGTAVVSSGSLFGTDSISGGSFAFTNKNIGTGTKVVTVSGVTVVDGNSGNNYNVSYANNTTSTITAANLAVTGVTVANKTYDATTAATLTGTAAVAALGSDTVTVSGGSGTFADKNVGTGKTVTVTGFSLGGADAGNYNVVQPTGLTANITAANLAITGVGAANKTYDATTAATLTGTATVAALGSDTVTVSGTGSGVFADKNVGTGKAVTVTGFTLAGADAGNYVAVQPTGVTANITAANLAITGVGAANKTYDVTTAATLTGTATVAALGSDTVTVAGTGSGVFANKNVGTSKTVTVTGYTLAGTDAGNYTVVQPTGVTADITQANLLVTGISASNKVYDATTAATLTGTAAVAALGSDTVTVGGTGAGVFNNKNVGTGKAVTVTGYTLGGADAANYAIQQPTGVTANITAANLAITGVGAANKTYDATTAATLTGTATVSALGSDVVTASGGSGVFLDKNVGTGKTVTVTGFTLSGADAGNYTAVQPTGVTANITQANLAVTGISASNKTYDATTAASLIGTATVAALGSDTVTVGGTGTGVFNNKNVGTGKAVTVTGYTLGGADAANYAVVQPTGVTANITAANLAITGVGAANKTYDATTAATLTGTAAVAALGSDTVTVSGTGAGVFADKNVGTGKAVTVTGYSLAGADAGNYTVIQPSGVTANITAANLTLSTSNVTKVYDATTSAAGTASVTSGSLFGTDTISGGSFAFTNKNVGAGNKVVTVSGVTVSDGNSGNNYNVTYANNTTSTITAANLAVTGVGAANKVYDSTTAATLTGTAAVAALGSDVVTVSGGSGTFVDKNVGTSKTVNVVGFTLGGADAGNYLIVQPTGVTANITKANLAVTGISAVNKIYDATTTAPLTGAGSLAVLGSDVVTVSGTGVGVFADKNVGVGKAVTVTGYTLAGADAGNYSVVQPSGLIANITQAPLTLSTSNVTKVYDANLTASGTAVVSGGSLFGTDSISGGTFAFTNKNVGSGNKVVTVAGVTVNDGNSGGNYAVTYANNTTSTITPANLAVTGLSGTNKTYDGNTSTTLTGTAAIAPLGSDSVSLTVGSATFADKNVGNGKVVNATGFSISGVDASNYTLLQPSGLTANITQLGSVTWVGPTSGGNWANPSNWAGGAIPDLSNVANVIIPTGTTVIFDNTVTGPVNLTQLSSGGLTLNSGTLNVASSTTLTDFTQVSGTFGGAGSLTVSNAVSQVGGNIAVGGDVNLTHATGPLSFVDIAGNKVMLTSTTGAVILGKVTAAGNLSVTANGGSITQAASTNVNVSGSTDLTAGNSASPADITLANAGNVFKGPITYMGKAVKITGSGAGIRLPDGVVNAVAQIEGEQRLMPTGAQSQQLLTESEGDDSGNSGKGTNTTSFGKGTTLKIVDGGTKLPDNLINVKN